MALWKSKKPPVENKWLVITLTKTNMFSSKREFRDVFGPYKYRWWAKWVSWMKRGKKCGCTINSWVTEDLGLDRPNKKARYS